MSISSEMDPPFGIRTHHYSTLKEAFAAAKAASNLALGWSLTAFEVVTDETDDSMSSVSEWRLCIFSSAILVHDED